MILETATLGGGCFWCLEAAYLEVNGVLSVESGYAGGHVRNPSYKRVCCGETGHAEVVKVDFNPSSIHFAEIIEIFFALHDPTQLNRQGNDTGPQYRSVIFTHSDQQREIALAVIDDITRAGLYDAPIVTKVLPLDGNYWPAEPDHQNYFARHPEQSYCTLIIAPKLTKFKQKFARYLRD